MTIEEIDDQIKKLRAEFTQKYGELLDKKIAIMQKKEAAKNA